MAFNSLSIIAFVAALTNQPCPQVFEDLTKDFMKPERYLSESLQLRDLAQEACRTTNPDIVWQIAKVETNFGFDILRFNKTHKVLRGEQAVGYLEGLKETKKPVNIDIGVMQVNWYWHRPFFRTDPLVMAQPQMQVRYLVEEMAPFVKKFCRTNWIGCYHNPANGPRAKRYNKWIAGARGSLRRAASKYLKHLPQPIPLAPGLALSKEQERSFIVLAHNLKQTDIQYRQVPQKLLVLRPDSTQDSELAKATPGSEGIQTASAAAETQDLIVEEHRDAMTEMVDELLHQAFARARTRTNEAIF